MDLTFFSQFVVGGVLGSMAKVIIESDGHFAFPAIELDVKGRQSLYLGTFGNIFVGVVVAIAVDHSFYVAVFSSIAGSYVIEKSSTKMPLIMNMLFSRSEKDG